MACTRRLCVGRGAWGLTPGTGESMMRVYEIIKPFMPTLKMDEDTDTHL